ncbi:DUF7341 domain-containing protein [Nocardia flavorosea]|uniref:Uncharacterized protein n=1 Tax=Nocardia flavorosea TaxID=53429 RepID=A0A846YS51_9NOCA|nr:hypothetical protein [Nocardia flavorosea]NKY60380.1 hypothetical protein [Nocardia flavorosea]
MTETPELVAGARTAFSDAVHLLVGLRADSIERDDFMREHVILDSLYQELQELRFGEKQGSESVRRATHGSAAPGNVSAISLLDDIDRTVRSWWPNVDSAEHQPTVARLYTLCDWPWTPDELADLKRMTRTVEQWVERANSMLAPDQRHTYELRAACPSCGETYLSVDDGAGEMVRKYVLQASQSSAECLACGMNWAPENYRALAYDLGAPLPEGVLE